MEGIVKFFNEEKGFGFIEPKNGKKDVFIHISNLEGNCPREGDRVTFEVEEGKKGPQAVNLAIVS